MMTSHTNDAAQEGADASDHNVYIVGAGFSWNAGAPLIHDFLDRAREHFDDPSSGLQPGERAHFRTVFDFRRKMAQSREKIRIDLDDIEQLFGLVEMSRRLNLIPLETRKSTVYVIAKTLELALGRHRDRPLVGFSTNNNVIARVGTLPGNFDLRPNQQPPYYTIPMYEFFAALVAGTLDDPDKRPSRKNTVITFNYDLVLDSALRRLGLAVDYGLLTPPMDSMKTVRVLKLHGSTNWVFCENCNEVTILEDKGTQLYEELRSHSCRCGNIGLWPLLIPPSWDKSDHRSIVQPVWEAAQAALKDATRICIIGYSMPETDTFFKYLLTLALAENHQLYRLVVVDKGDKLQRRFEDLLEPLFRARRFSYWPEGLSQWLVDQRAYRELGRGEVIQSLSLY
jgi:NAD-dependent SIR2 family protein deacetylase